MMSDAASANERTIEVLLTPEGYRALSAELEHLTQVKRPEIADRIRESLQHGEFSEDNNELDEVKFEQAMVETRIADLKGIFAAAHELDLDSIPTDHVGIGSYVKLLDTEYHDEFTVRLVCSIEADPDRDMLSVDSPMGSAIFEQEAGDEVEFLAPDGKKVIKILQIWK